MVIMETTSKKMELNNEYIWVYRNNQKWSNNYVINKYYIACIVDNFNYYKFYNSYKKNNILWILYNNTKNKKRWKNNKRRID
jgi:hypothetical protein